MAKETTVKARQGAGYRKSTSTTKPTGPRPSQTKAGKAVKKNSANKRNAY